jgi:subtilisin family serine protease
LNKGPEYIIIIATVEFILLRKRNMKAKKTLIFFLILLVTSSSKISASNANKLNSPDFLGFVPNEFIVILKDDAPPPTFRMSPAGFVKTGRANFDAAAENFKVKRIKKQFPSAQNHASAASARKKLFYYYKISFENGTLNQAMQAYRKLPSVEHVEPIGVHTVNLQPNDPYFQDSPNPEFLFDQWHYWSAAGVNTVSAWDIETGDPDVVVAVLDTGVRYFHVDLGGNNSLWDPDSPRSNGNIWINPGEIPGNDIDDDLNGYVDDTIGYDFVASTGGPGQAKCIDQDCDTIDNDPDDFDGHGTHVAGTIAAITNNNRLVAGIAGGFSNGSSSAPGNGVKIMPLRIGYRARHKGQDTGIVRMDWAAEAMTYIADQIDLHNINVAAINASWGSSNTGGIDAAVNNLLAHDVMLIHAAGNDNANSPGYLGSKAGVMNVAATDDSANGASFSNYGSWVDLAAPGVDILSTYSNPDDSDLTKHYIAILSGTSMSAPHACGVAALLESHDCSLTGPEKFNLMVNNTNPYTDARDLGSGILDAQKALLAVDPIADLNEDGFFNLLDIHIISQNWLTTGTCIPGNINHDNIVNFLDFTLLANSF